MWNNAKKIDEINFDNAYPEIGILTLKNIVDSSKVHVFW